LARQRRVIGQLHARRLFRPYRASAFDGFATQGVALGYDISPRWGLFCVRTEAEEQRNNNLPRNDRHTLTEVKSRQTGLSEMNARNGNPDTGDPPQGEEIR